MGTQASGTTAPGQRGVSREQYLNCALELRGSQERAPGPGNKTRKSGQREEPLGELKEFGVPCVTGGELLENWWFGEHSSDLGWEDGTWCSVSREVMGAKQRGDTR